MCDTWFFIVLDSLFLICFTFQLYICLHDLSVSCLAHFDWMMPAEIFFFTCDYSNNLKIADSTRLKSVLADPWDIFNSFHLSWPRNATVKQKDRAETQVKPRPFVCISADMRSPRCSRAGIWTAFTHAYTLLSSLAAFPINSSSQSSPTSACHHPPQFPLNYATQD